MLPRPRILVPPPVVQQLSERRYRATTTAFPELNAVQPSPDAADFTLRLLVQKRLYGRAWAWAPR